MLAVTKYALVMLGSAQWFGCIWWAVARFSGFGDTCWVTQYYRLVGKPINEATFRSSTYNYLLSLYWGFTVLVRWVCAWMPCGCGSSEREGSTA